MYLLGHVALGYFAAKTVRRITHENFSIPLIWLVSLLPDIDLLIPGLQHRGPTHSIIITLLLFTPILIILKRGLAYLAALATHTVIGDYFTSYGCQLLWPINPAWMKAPIPLLLRGINEIYLELILFGSMIVIMFLSREAASNTTP
jgi:membrane-bound metal-dependent hydrolase YbcI (DUF457 family)